MRLYELRREPSLNQKKKIVHELLKHANDPSLNVTFSTLPKVGIYPKSDWSTPNGVYCYPLHQFKEMLEWSQDSKTTAIFPYAADRIYAFIIKDTAKNALDFDKNISKDDYIKYMAYAIDKVVDEDSKSRYMEDLQSSIEDNYSIALYTGLKRIMRFSDLNYSNASNTFNKLLRTFGFDSIVDSGHGVIFDYSERTQTVFLTPSSYKVVDMYHNDTADRQERRKHHNTGLGHRNKNGIVTKFD